MSIFKHNVDVWTRRLGVESIDVNHNIVQAAVTASVWKDTARELALQIAASKFAYKEMGVATKHAMRVGEMVATVTSAIIYNGCKQSINDICDALYRQVDLDLSSAARQITAVAVEAYAKDYTDLPGDEYKELRKFKFQKPVTITVCNSAHPVLPFLESPYVRQIPKAGSVWTGKYFVFVNGGHGVITLNPADDTIQYHDVTPHEFKAAVASNVLVANSQEPVALDPINKYIGNDIHKIILAQQ